MAMREWLVRVAGKGPVPVFVALGHGADVELALLRSDSDVEVVPTPRQATVLAVVGAVPDALGDPLRTVHDQLPAPRATAVIGGTADPPGIPGSVRVDPDDLGGGFRNLHRRVLGGIVTDPELGPADNPVEWQGVGPFGTGGEGMMGGTPYGRPMAMTDMGRDGLALDRLRIEVGPFFPGLPPGITLVGGLQGDVLEEAEIRLAPPDPDSDTDPVDHRSLLVAAAELASLSGLEALARRAAALAVTPRPAPGEIARLRRALDRPWGLRVATDGVGAVHIDGEDKGDATHRWVEWLRRAEQLVGGHEPTGGLVHPVPVGALAEALVGMELGRALVTIASFRQELAVSSDTGAAR